MQGLAAMASPPYLCPLVPMKPALGRSMGKGPWGQDEAILLHLGLRRSRLVVTQVESQVAGLREEVFFAFSKLRFGAS